MSNLAIPIRIVHPDETTPLPRWRLSEVPRSTALVRRDLLWLVHSIVAAYSFESDQVSSAPPPSVLSVTELESLLWGTLHSENRLEAALTLALRVDTLLRLQRGIHDGRAFSDLNYLQKKLGCSSKSLYWALRVLKAESGLYKQPGRNGSWNVRVPESDRDLSENYIAVPNGGLLLQGHDFFVLACLHWWAEIGIEDSRRKLIPLRHTFEDSRDELADLAGLRVRRAEKVFVRLAEERLFDPYRRELTPHTGNWPIARILGHD